ncbi:hypothetical protein CCUS01_10340 [Colletotrichum cuscutae]|uniref:Zn(2)-C6 fungal-type domain-containing protein n=1 Tax=Colletotrichum cuscutae TaxID=1209917 RepID=A0AAI9XQ01_9PEZI|nr:hypothetical protein CCUS01_10340 [Colletotrichum cuscutae]
MRMLRKSRDLLWALAVDVDETFGSKGTPDTCEPGPNDDNPAGHIYPLTHAPMTVPVAPAHSNGAASRSSLACLPCRSRHLKCDGKRPHCDRCATAAKDCQYAPSRRGGLDRVALAERRKRLAVAYSVGNSSSESPTSLPSQQSTDPQIFGQDSLAELNLDLSIFDDVSLENQIPTSAPPANSTIRPDDLENDALINAYYTHFHKFHPFLLPQEHFTRFRQDPNWIERLRPLISTMHLVGHIYAARKWSSELQDDVESRLSEPAPNDPVIVQCRLLYSIALFWYSHKTEAKRQMDLAVLLVLDLQMFQKEFVATHGAESPVLMECWRRTWWMLYIIDAYYAGTLGTMNFAVVEVDSSVELPCTESEYESGDIPEPQTLEEFDLREFASEDTSYSSFAYLIGAVKCAALAISTTPKLVAREDSMRMIEEADSIIDGWSLLLPEDRRHIMSKTGEIDELMFQAHLLINVFLLKGKELAVARDQIRMTIGCLKTLGKVWPRTAKNVREIQTIAQHVLGLKPRLNGERTATDTAGSLAVTDKGDAGNSNSQTSMSSSQSEVFASLGTMDDVCGWYNMEGISSQLSHWVQSDI